MQILEFLRKKESEGVLYIFYSNDPGPEFFHYENMPIQIYWEFYHQKMKIFR